MLRRTPVVPVSELGPSVFLKLENLQITGSFKVRGAMRKLSSLSEQQRAAGVITSSAGNHGLGLALAARELGVRATVYVSKLTPAVKRDGIARLGAEIVVEGANYDEAEAIAKARAADTGATFVSPYDDEAIIAGNGDSLAEELAAQLPDLRRVIAPVGGGGLIGGIARTLVPRGVEVYGAQPEANCAMRDSLAAGRALTTYHGGETLAEGCEGAVAERTYELARRFVAGIEVVSEQAIRDAVAFLYHRAGQIAEASAAVGVAAIRTGALAPAGDGATAVVVTGGNIDAPLLAELISPGRSGPARGGPSA